MADERFDLRFSGTIAEGADSREVRHKLGAMFKLDDQGCDKLFSGHPVVIKHQADAHTAAQYQQAFARAGAILEVVPVGVPEPAPAAPVPPSPAPTAPEPEATAEPATPDIPERESEPSPEISSTIPWPPPRPASAQNEPLTPAGLDELAAIDGSKLAIASNDGFLETPRTGKMRDIDLGELSLVTNADWSLEDCEKAPEPVAKPDTSHLQLEEIEVRPENDDEEE